MNGLKKPRRPRPLNYDPFGKALLCSTRLTQEERASIMDPNHFCLKALREGVATDVQVTILDSGLRIAMAIENSRIVRGLAGHIGAGQQALAAIRARAERDGEWKPAEPAPDELEAIQTAYELHEFQLKQLSAGELHRIVQRQIATVRSQGGEALHISREEVLNQTGRGTQEGNPE